MKESAINYNIPVPSDNKPPEISQPRKSSFDFPATFISSHLATIMVFTFLIVVSIWANQFNASLFQLFAIIITIVTFISYQPLRLLFRPSASCAWHCDSVERFFEERLHSWSQSPGGCPKEFLCRRPPPSTSFPCRVWFFRHTSPLFSRRKTAVNKCFAPA